MYGEAAMGESALAEGASEAAPIIPEVGVETRQLIYVFEIDLIPVAE